jgi:hypothetical protein
LAEADTTSSVAAADTHDNKPVADALTTRLRNVDGAAT